MEGGSRSHHLKAYLLPGLNDYISPFGKNLGMFLHLINGSGESSYGHYLKWVAQAPNQPEIWFCYSACRSKFIAKHYPLPVLHPTLN